MHVLAVLTRGRWQAGRGSSTVFSKLPSGAAELRCRAPDRELPRFSILQFNMRTLCSSLDEEDRRYLKGSRSETLRRAFLALLSVGLVSLACAPHSSALPPLQNALISGDHEIVNQLAGRWYHQDVLMIVVQSARSPQLSVRAGERTRLKNAHAEQRGIRFELETEERTIELLFQSLGDGVTIALPPDMSPAAAWCGTCHPRLTRSTRMARTVPRATAWGDSSRSFGARSP